MTEPTTERIAQVGYINDECLHALISIYQPALINAGENSVQVALTITSAETLHWELGAFLRKHYSSVEPPREMLDMAWDWLRVEDRGRDLGRAANSLAALLTAVRSQAIAEAAKVVEQYDWGQNYEIQNPTQHQVAVAASIRSLR